VLVADVLGDVVVLGDAPLVRGHGLLVSHHWENMPANVCGVLRTAVKAE
jgi:hypothetical protein